jgi:hypothetical protein
MGVWEPSVYVAGFLAVALLLVALRWAAIERARAHRQWAALARTLGEKGHRLIDWWMVWSVAGCV